MENNTTMNNTNVQENRPIPQFQPKGSFSVQKAMNRVQPQVQGEPVVAPSNSEQTMSQSTIDAFNQRRGQFRVDRQIYDKVNDVQENANAQLKISPEIRDKAIAGVLASMTNIQGTPEEKAAHAEMLSLCVIGDKTAQKNVKALIEKIIEKDMRLLTHGRESTALVDYIYKNYYGLGPIDDLVGDPTINEVWVNAYNQIWIEKNGRKERINAEFKNENDIMRIIRLLLNFNKMDISVQEPIREARMLDGSRITILIPPVAKHPTINIRKFDAFEVTTENLVSAGTISKDMVPWIENIVKGRSNIMIIGETGSGKTSFLKWLIGLMNPSLRLGTIETNFELKIDEKYPERNIFSYECHEELGIDMNSIFKECLRSSPDIIICGEARGLEANELIKAMRRGHEGSIGTIHTNSAETCIPDIHEMINEDNHPRDYKSNCFRIASALNFIIQIRKFEDTGIRRIERITEVIPDVSDMSYSLNDIFRYEQNEDNPKESKFTKVGELHQKTIDKLVRFGVPYSVAKTM